MSKFIKKYHFIYKTTNRVTGYYYYGMHSTDNLDDGYLGSGQRLWYSIRKYGKEVHMREILEFCKDRTELIKREFEIVNMNEIAKEKCMNMMEGGTGGYSEKNFGGAEGRYKGRVNSNRVIAQRILNDKEFNKYFRKRTSEGLKKFYSENVHNWLGQKHTEETKQKIRESSVGKHAGEKNSQYGTCWIHDGRQSKKIKKDKISIYLEKGWIKGRIMK